MAKMIGRKDCRQTKKQRWCFVFVQEEQSGFLLHGRGSFVAATEAGDINKAAGAV
jgi:hypothetical protein